MKRYYVVFEGRVQGVGFRWKLTTIAQKYNVTGWVRNRYDEKVECEMQGEEFNLKQVIKEINGADRFIIIEDYQIKEIPLKEKEHEFRPTY